MTPMRKLAIAGALAGLSVAGGAIGATVIGTAGAQTSTSTPSTSTGTSTETPAASSQPSFPEHGSAAHEDAEKPVTGDAATKAKAAAVKSVGSGTAGDVTTDFTGNGYEVTVTKTDGSQVEVHMDSSFNVGFGGHGDHDGDHGGDHGGLTYGG